MTEEAVNSSEAETKMKEATPVIDNVAERGQPLPMKFFSLH